MIDKNTISMCPECNSYEHLINMVDHLKKIHDIQAGYSTMILRCVATGSLLHPWHGGFSCTMRINGTECKCTQVSIEYDPTYNKDRVTLPAAAVYLKNLPPEKEMWDFIII